VGRQRLRVIPHTGAASQISEGDDGGSHDGSCNRGRAALYRGAVRPENGWQVDYEPNVSSVGQSLPPVIKRIRRWNVT
jgi:hypothetical protein